MRGAAVGRRVLLAVRPSAGPVYQSIRPSVRPSIRPSDRSVRANHSTSRHNSPAPFAVDLLGSILHFAATLTRAAEDRSVTVLCCHSLGKREPEFGRSSRLSTQSKPRFATRSPVSKQAVRRQGTDPARQTMLSAQGTPRNFTSKERHESSIVLNIIRE